MGQRFDVRASSVVFLFFFLISDGTGYGRHYFPEQPLSN
jgi:hypothetical protein